MRDRLIIFFLLPLCGVPVAFAQCGSARTTDVDGSFVSSTSTDQCGGGHTFLVQKPASTPETEQTAERNASLVPGLTSPVELGFSNREGWKRPGSIVPVWMNELPSPERRSARLLNGKLLLWVPTVTATTSAMLLAVPPSLLQTSLDGATRVHAVRTGIGLRLPLPSAAKVVFAEAELVMANASKGNWA